MDKPRALVVDDDEPIRALLVNLVEHLDFAVDSARDGAEAIARLDDDGYDVILLDLMMPRVDGWAVLDHMSLAEPDRLRHTIVALSPKWNAIRTVSRRTSRTRRFSSTCVSTRETSSVRSAGLARRSRSSSR